ncbi:MAG: sigma-54-dependent Fis family transcriptional regulator [Planctomycetes bacterium]|nr:sigma-54-dependent Fis family transcriptional regulator [Planctomycetota bacterium]
MSSTMFVGPQQWSRELVAMLDGRAAAVEDFSAALGVVLSLQPKLAVIWGGLDESQALAFIGRCRQDSADTAIVVVADVPDTASAIRYVRAGAYDYLPGPLNASRLSELATSMNQQQQSSNQARYFCPNCPPGVKIVGRSSAVVRMLEMIRIVAESRCNPVLLLGETGTGKELAARAVHAWRHASSGQFVAVNCATLTANLLESELFGHAKGAFTGADREKTGLLELANGGSIFLDEISEMPMELQAKLLRFLQERTFRKVGGTKDISCTATVIASSNLKLFDQAMAGKFRKDLYYRLAVVPIKISPLRSADRRDDIPLLADYFIRSDESVAPGKLEGLSQEARAELMRHDWPGNVRELKNVIERASIFEMGRHITAASLMIERTGEGPSGPASPTMDFSLEAAEREFICRALQETNWQRTRAASLLGITRATLHAKIKRYDIKLPAQSAAEDKSENVSTVPS